MLPAVKVFAVAALLGGGAVGTFALAGGFGPKGNGTGNGGTTAQVAATETAKPATTEQGAPAAPSVGTALPVEGTERDSGDGAVDVGVQQESGVGTQRGENLGTDVQAQQQAVLQTSNQDSSRPQTLDSTAEGKDTVDSSSSSGTPGDPQTGQQETKGAGSKEVQSATENGKTNLESEGVVNNPSDTSPEGTPGASPTAQREASGANEGGNERSDGVSDSLPESTSNPRSTGPSETISTSDPNASNTGEDGTDGDETRVASGGEETRTATGTQDS